MQTPAKIVFAAGRLKAGHRVNRITVRDFLRHFGTERRGAVKVEGIQRILDALDLRTDPDFATAWIDSPMLLRLKSDVDEERPKGSAGGDAEDDLPLAEMGEDLVLEGTPSAVTQAVNQVQDAPVSDIAEDRGGDNQSKISLEDPTFRIGSLPAANKPLVVVGQEDKLANAVTLMLHHDFAQLPVMQGEREVKGMITWKSIATVKAFERQCEAVLHCTVSASIVDSDTTLFDAIPTIVENGYVLVRSRADKKITGIVTSSDLALHFQAQTEPFLLLREVELHLRQLLGEKVTIAEIQDLVGAAAPNLRLQNIADLTFGQYVRLFQHDVVCSKLALKIDFGVLTKMLEKVRIIRNDVMHFDPDPVDVDDLKTLKLASQFMRQVFELTS